MDHEKKPSFLVPDTKKFLTQKELKMKMSSDMPFVFNAVELCAVIINGKPWIRAREVCRTLEYDAKTSETAKIINAHVSPENMA